MKTYNTFFISGVAYITYWFVVAVDSVGTIPQKQSPYEWYFPFLVLGYVLIPFVLGYFGGKK